MECKLKRLGKIKKIMINEIEEEREWNKLINSKIWKPICDEIDKTLEQRKIMKSNIKENEII
jgi:hypothetical protein